jgi:hypothetical protein
MAIYLSIHKPYEETGDGHGIGATYLAEQLFYGYMLPSRVGHVVAG